MPTYWHVQHWLKRGVIFIYLEIVIKEIERENHLHQDLEPEYPPRVSSSRWTGRNQLTSCLFGLSSESFSLKSLAGREQVTWVSGLILHNVQLVLSSAGSRFSFIFVKQCSLCIFTDNGSSYEHLWQVPRVPTSSFSFFLRPCSFLCSLHTLTSTSRHLYTRDFI